MLLPGCSRFLIGLQSSRGFCLTPMISELTQHHIWHRKYGPQLDVIVPVRQDPICSSQRRIISVQRQCNMECFNDPFWSLSLYTANLDVIVTNHGLMSYFYVDDSLLYLYCRPDQIQQLRVVTIECIMDIVSWMKSNRLRLNPAKTEFVWLATPS